MFNSSVLDVAIGLVFVYLLLSLICTAAREVIEGWLMWRATNLAAGIRELLADPNGEGLTKGIYDHPLICSLYRGAYHPRTWGEVFRKLFSTNLPSYIPAHNFALALMDVALGPVRVPPGAGPMEMTSPPLSPPTSPPTPPGRPLRELIGTMANDEVRRALLTLADAAGDDVNRFQAEIEAWFNSAMDRVSGWYKRWSQLVILGLGLALAIALNADTLAIATTLSQNPAARQKLIDAAAEYTRDPKHQKPPDAAKDKTPQEELKDNLRKLDTLGLPFGWDDHLVPRRGDQRGWSLKAGGWLLTALAISLGAPFWFDLLNKFMVVRSTVKPQEKSPPEAPKGSAGSKPS